MKEPSERFDPVVAGWIGYPPSSRKLGHRPRGVAAQLSGRQAPHSGRRLGGGFKTDAYAGSISVCVKSSPLNSNGSPLFRASA